MLPERSAPWQPWQAFASTMARPSAMAVALSPASLVLVSVESSELEHAATAPKASGAQKRTRKDLMGRLLS
jgi:hypothetical protein